MQENGALKHCAARRFVACAMALKSSVVAAGALLFFIHSAWSAAAPLPAPVRDFTTYMPTAKATRIEANEAPVIDGDLSDPVWQKAMPITEFYQIEPNTGQPGSERTELRFLYDADNLYIAVYAYDREPDQIRFTTKNRDGSFVADDGVRIYLDPLNTRRNAYHFIVNALGARIDELIQNNTDFGQAVEHDLDRTVQNCRRRLDGGDRHPVPRSVLRSGETRLGDRFCPGHSPPQRERPLELHQRCATARRYLSRRHADRHHRHQSGPRTRYPALRIDALPLRLAAATTGDQERAPKRQCLLQDHAP